MIRRTQPATSPSTRASSRARRQGLRGRESPANGILTERMQARRAEVRSLQRQEEQAHEESMSASTSVEPESRAAPITQEADIGASEALTQHALTLLDALGEHAQAQQRAISSELSDLSSASDQLAASSQAPGDDSQAAQEDTVVENASVISEASSTGSNTLRALAECNHTQDSAERQVLMEKSLRLLQRWKTEWHALEKKVQRGQAKREGDIRAQQRQAVQRQRVLEHQANERTMTTRQAKDS